MKTFTLDEAQSLLPILESLLKRAMEGKRAAEAVESSLNDLARRIYLNGGMKIDTVAVTAKRAELEGHLQLVGEMVAEMDAIGVQVKDVESGLLDFPCRLGETSIDHWHTTDSGFKDRQPIDERFRRCAPGGRPN